MTEETKESRAVDNGSLREVVKRVQERVDNMYGKGYYVFCESHPNPFSDVGEVIVYIDDGRNKTPVAAIQHTRSMEYIQTILYY